MRTGNGGAPLESRTPRGLASDRARPRVRNYQVPNTTFIMKWDYDCQIPVRNLSTSRNLGFHRHAVLLASLARAERSRP